jgi:hypothetical protein
MRNDFITPDEITSISSGLHYNAFKKYRTLNSVLNEMDWEEYCRSLKHKTYPAPIIRIEIAKLAAKASAYFDVCCNVFCDKK